MNFKTHANDTISFRELILASILEAFIPSPNGAPKSAPYTYIVKQ